MCLGVFLLPPEWDASPLLLTPSIKLIGTHLYNWVERGTVRVKCLDQEHNTISLAKARNQITGSRGERTNHEATAPQLKERRTGIIKQCFVQVCDMMEAGSVFSIKSNRLRVNSFLVPLSKLPHLLPLLLPLCQIPSA